MGSVEGSAKPAERPGKKSRANSAGLLLSVVVLLPWLLTGCGMGGQGNTQPPPPSLSLSSSPRTVSVLQGSSGNATITVRATGVSGNVSLSASGLPSGVTAAFNPSSTANTSTLTLTTSGGAALGTSAITVTGTVGSLNATASVNITVFVPPPPNAVAASYFALNNVDPTDDPAQDGMSYGAVGHPIRLAWPYIETAKGSFDFSFYDQYAAIAPREGPNNSVAVMDLTLGMTPGWAVSNQSTCRTLSNPGGPTITGCQAPPDNIQDWKDFITALVNHYDGSTAARPYIKYYEIWNEWNVVDAENGFWTGTLPQLAMLQSTACTIIHAVPGQQSMVLTPSTVGPAAASSDSAPQQLDSYFSSGGTKCPGAPNDLIEGVSFHGNLAISSVTPFPLPGEGCPSSNCNGTILEITNSYRTIMEQNGLPTTPMFDTEGGFESASIPDIDQRAAWLAQFYALQGGLYNTDQLQWVSWFTWGWNPPPGVAGQIETSNHQPDPAGNAYSQVFNWLVGRLPSPCSQTGKVWNCSLTGSGGYQAEILWDDLQTCSNGNCTTGQQTSPSWAVKMRDLTGKITAITGGSAVQFGLKPVIFENQ